MYIQQIYTGCLAQGAYYIESQGEAAIIDPLREVQPYLDLAQKRGATIKYVLETHFHADFVSGHIDLAKKSGATIVIGQTPMELGYAAHQAEDNEILPLGNAGIQVLHTPGHTLESVCYLVHDAKGTPQALFSGDTLFIGDVGRPDLAQHVVADLNQEFLAGKLYDSLRNKILPLPDALLVYPAHGAGSACGKNMSKETWDTLGHQKQTNYALQTDLSRERFIEMLLDGLPKPPAYFPENVRLNIHGYSSFDAVLKAGLRSLNPTEFEYLVDDSRALVLDTRAAASFSAGFIPNSINIGIDGNFAPWVGALVPDIQQPIVLVCDLGREEEVITRLSRVGFDHVLGFLEGGFEHWKATGKEWETVQNVSPAEFAQSWRENPDTLVLDVRKESEFAAEHCIGAHSFPLDTLNDRFSELDPDRTYFVHCAGGYRSMIFASILKARGFHRLINVSGGFSAIKTEGSLPLTQFVCPSTLAQ